MNEQNKKNYQANVWWGELSDETKEFYRQYHYPRMKKEPYLVSHVVRIWLYDKYNNPACNGEGLCGLTLPRDEK